MKQKLRRKQRKETKVLDLEKAKTAQAKEIANLKKRVKKLERKKSQGLQGRIDEIDANRDLSLIDKTAQDQGRINEEDLFRVNDLDGDEVIVDVTVDVEVTTAAATPQISKDDVTLAQTLIEIKAAKPRARGVIVQEPKLEKPLKKKDQIALDEEVARKLEAQMKAKIEEDKRISKEKDKANIALIEQWDDVQAIIDVDKQLAKQLQAQEREQLSIEERSRLLAELIESRRKYFAAKRAKEIKNKPLKEL
nr:hypothetical protein [Tanacetum cinerariifolium]